MGGREGRVGRLERREEDEEKGRRGGKEENAFNGNPRFVADPPAPDHRFPANLFPQRFWQVSMNCSGIDAIPKRLEFVKHLVDRGSN